MEDLKRILPVFPKSIEEHDREVNETWKLENGIDNNHEQDNLKQLMKETMLNGLPDDLADAILNGDDRAVAEKIERYKGGE